MAALHDLPGPLVRASLKPRPSRREQLDGLPHLPGPLVRASLKPTAAASTAAVGGIPSRTVGPGLIEAYSRSQYGSGWRDTFPDRWSGPH